MSENTLDRGGLSRRGFMGAAAVTAAGAAAAGALGPLRPGAGADSDPSAHDMRLPDDKVGIQSFTIGGYGTASNREPYTTILRDAGIVAVEGASGNYLGFANSAAGHTDYAAYMTTKGIALVGDHNGPSPTDQTRQDLAVAKMNAWNAGYLGQGGGVPNGGNGNTSGTAGGGNRAATQAACEAAVTSMRNFAITLNLYGQRYQQGFNLDNVGARRDNSQWYPHMHTEWSEFLFLDTAAASFSKFQNMRAAEVLLDPTDGLDDDYAWLEIDLAWFYKGHAPYPGDAVPNTTAATGNRQLTRVEDQQLAADNCVEVFRRNSNGNRSKMFHVKDVDSNGSVANTGDPAGDLTPFARLFSELSDPADHIYHIERDGASTNSANSNYWGLVCQQGRALLVGTDIDRSTTGAAGNVDKPLVSGVAKVGKKLRCENQDRGTWVRLPQYKVTQRWLRQTPGSPSYIAIPGATGPGYVLTPADASSNVACETTAENVITLAAIDGGLDGNTVSGPAFTAERSLPVVIDAAGPGNTTLPLLTGSGKAGTRVTTTIGDWDSGGTTTVAWFFASAINTPVNNNAGNDKQFQTSDPQIGETLLSKVTRTNGSGTTTALSSNSIPIIPRP